jgi:carbonic anhydrase
MIRRIAMGLFSLALFAPVAIGQDCAKCADITPKDSAAAWALLDRGNDEFAHGTRLSGADAMDACRRLCAIGEGKQKPFAVVLSCSDARVPAEMVFNQRLGDVFVVRVAGNVPTAEGIGSIEYAIRHLKSPKILVVMGHQDCGAVKAAITPGPAHDMIPSLLNLIYPAVKGSKDLDHAIEDNVALAVKLLPRYSPIIGTELGAQNIRGAVYSFKTGRVSLVAAK